MLHLQLMKTLMQLLHSSLLPLLLHLPHHIEAVSLAMPFSLDLVRFY